MCLRLFHTFSSIRFSAFGFMLRSLIQLDLSFVEVDIYGSNCILPHSDIQLDQYHLLKMPFTLILYGFTSGFLVQFHWSTCLILSKILKEDKNKYLFVPHRAGNDRINKRYHPCPTWWTNEFVIIISKVVTSPGSHLNHGNSESDTTEDSLDSQQDESSQICQVLTYCVTPPSPEELGSMNTLGKSTENLAYLLSLIDPSSKRW